MKKSTLKKNTISSRKEIEMKPSTLHLHEQFLTDDKGHKKAVVLDMKEYQKMWELLEDAVDLKMIAKRKKDRTVPHDAFRRLLKEDGLL